MLRMKTEDDVTSCCKGSLGGFSALSSPLMTRNARHGGPSLPSDEKIIVEGFTLNGKLVFSSFVYFIVKARRQPS